MPVEEKYYVALKSAAGFEVTRFEATSPPETWRIDHKGKCSCPGFDVSGSCRHVLLTKRLDETVTASTVSPAKGAQIVKKIQAALERVVTNLNMDDQDTDANGNVTLIRMSGHAKDKTENERNLQAIVEGVRVAIVLR